MSQPLYEKSRLKNVANNHTSWWKIKVERKVFINRSRELTGYKSLVTRKKVLLAICFFIMRFKDTERYDETLRPLSTHVGFTNTQRKETNRNNARTKEREKRKQKKKEQKNKYGKKTMKKKKERKDPIANRCNKRCFNSMLSCKDRWRHPTMVHNFVLFLWTCPGDL